MKFKVCVIGCGFMSSWVHGPSFMEYARLNNDTELTGCCDLSEEKAVAFQEKFGFKKAYTDYNEMFKTEKPDAVCLISNVLDTKRLAVDIMKKGFPVMMEKPPGLNLEECLEIIEASERYQVPARVAFNRRYQPIMKDLKNMLHLHVPDKNFYNIYYNMIRCHRYDNDFSTTTIHAIDTVRFLADSDYKYINLNYQHLPEFGEHVANIYMDGELNSGAKVRLEFLVAAGAGIERCVINSFENTFLLNTPLGSDAPGKLTHIKNNNIISEIVGEENAEYFINGGFYNENADFFDLVKKGNFEMITDVKSGLQSVIIADSIRRRETRIEF